MTDNEIIKALEICVSEEIRCSECPFDEVCGNFEIKDLLDLINRQKVEIEKLNTVNAEMHESLRLACERNKDLQAEIERLNGLVADGDKAFNKMTELYNKAFNRCRKVKAEAIKELLDKIEKQAIPSEDDVYWVELDDIYNLVKEMVGDTE